MIWWNPWFVWFARFRMCIHIGSTVVLFISSQYMILVVETLDCLVFLDIYEMPSFVDNYEMLSFVAILRCWVYLKYEMLIYLNTYVIRDIYENLQSFIHCVRRRCWDSCRWIHMRCLDEHIWNVECFPIFEMNSCMFIVWNCKDGLASGRCLRRATPGLHDAREG